jgi:hypothetical protein
MLLAASAVPMSADLPPRMSVEAQNIRLADSGQPRTTGGIIALYPRAVDAQTLAVLGGEPPEYLHLTLVDFGDDVSGRADNELRRVLDRLTAAHPHPIEAQVFGRATLNLNGEEPDTAVVYLVGDSDYRTTKGTIQQAGGEPGKLDTRSLKRSGLPLTLSARGSY